MTKQNNINSRSGRIMRLMLAVVLGVFVSAFSFGAVTAHAETENEVTVEAEQASTSGSAENGSGAMVILMGGMLIIILAVVLSVVGTFVSSAAIVDEL
ncbi:MAG: hypothetical protein K2M91_15270 [Lachnospiraceae bacterium]|nr:hypothetical protein [Lachnospiraceae bacterium]